MKPLNVFLISLLCSVVSFGIISFRDMPAKYDIVYIFYLLPFFIFIIGLISISEWLLENKFGKSGKDDE